MKIFLAMACGALTSAAWVAPRPLYYLFMVLSALLFLLTRGMQ
jgi:hypothetical protein